MNYKNIFLNDLQTGARAGMAFVVFVLLLTVIWDWKVRRKKPFRIFTSVIAISVFTQIPKVLRSNYSSLEDFKRLFIGVIQYCFSYLNTLTELLERLPDPNLIGRRTILPLYNLISRIFPNIERYSIAHAEKSNIWGFNNYTLSQSCPLKSTSTPAVGTS